MLAPLFYLIRVLLVSGKGGFPQHFNTAFVRIMYLCLGYFLFSARIANGNVWRRIANRGSVK